MSMENSEKTEYRPMFDIKPENLVISKEDLKFKNIEPRKKEQFNRNYDFLFSEVESERIHQLVNKYYSQLTTKGQGIKSLGTALRLRFIEKVKRFYIEEEDIWEVILLLTSNITNERREQLLEYLRTNGLVNEVKENNGSIGIKTSFCKIRFSEIGNFFPDLEVDDEIKTDSRVGKCHSKAVEFSKKLKDIGIENDVVTANRCITADKIKYLHSWVELCIKSYR